MRLSGRCECGKVQFSMDNDVEDYSHCHCSQCRRLHGAAFATFIGVARSEFQYDAGHEHIKKYDSSARNTRVFCDTCGSSILVEPKAEPESVYVALALIDSPVELPEGYHIYVDSKVPWYSIQDGLTQHGQEPPYDD